MSIFIPPQELIIYETEFWSVNHRINTSLPGYVIVSTKLENISCLDDLPLEARSELGIVLAKVERSINYLFKPEWVYISRYGHSPGFAMHFHTSKQWR